ncbi:hypothetical protein TNCV_4954051 [Trichonephila clavipes]|nr:hypothetical protein TNCV_4954051 [Trichonephila clavipes]
MTPPPQDTLVSRKLMTGYARDFTGRECTEMSFAIASFLSIALELISLGDFQSLFMETKWIIVCTDYFNTICNNKSLADSRSRRNIEVFLLEEIVLRHGAPRVIITEIVEPSFRSRLVSSLVDLCNIDHRFNNGVSSPNKWTDGALQ